MQAKLLKHFRNKLLEKKASLINSVQKSESYGREADSDNEAADIVDKASNSYTKEFMFSMSNADRQSLMLVDKALERIENGTYGACQNCEEPIDRKRLEAVPWALLCIKCQELEEQKRQ